MQQIGMKENLPHPDHKAGEGQWGRTSTPWNYVQKTIIQSKKIVHTNYINHTIIQITI